MGYSICLTITPQCNWGCEYCIANTKKSSNIPKDKLISTFNNCINYLETNEFKGETIVISGGEPGLITYEQFETLLETIYNIIEKGNEVCLNTNGTFFKLIESYPKLANKEYNQKQIETLQKIQFRYHMFESIDIFLENQRKISKRFSEVISCIEDYQLDLEYQVIFTKLDSIQNLERCLNVLLNRKNLFSVCIKDKIIITPAKLSSRNKMEIQTCFGPNDRISLVKYQRAVFNMYEAYGLEITNDRRQAFDEAYGMKTVKYKTHEN